MNHLREIEVKHAVAEKDLKKFLNYMTTKYSYMNSVFNDGSDVYYTKGKSDVFIRHRKQNGVDRELTIKIKRSKLNSIDRFEYDILLKNNEPGVILGFIKALKYKPSFTLIKRNWIFYSNVVTIAWSKVNDMTGKTLFVLEIEPSKYTPRGIRMGVIDKWEKRFKFLNISKKTRIKESLFDIFRVNNNNKRIKRVTTKRKTKSR